MLFTLVNATGNVQKIVKDARKRDELLKQGYVEILLEDEEPEQEAEETTLPPEDEEPEQEAEETTLPPEDEEPEQEESKPEPKAKKQPKAAQKADDKE